MAIEHILLRPQVLQRPISSAEKRMAEELMDMASRLMADSVKGGRAREKFLEGAQAAFTSLVEDVRTRMGVATQHFKEWLEPFLQAFSALGGSLGNLSSTSEGIHALGQLLLLLADLLSNLAPGQVEAKLLALLRIITEDLGLTRGRMERVLGDAVDIVAQKMKADFLGGDHSEQAHNEFLIGCYLEKLKRFLDVQLSTLEFELDLPGLISQMGQYLQRVDWNRVRLAAQQMLTEVGSTVEGLGILFDIFSGKFNVSVEVSVNSGGGGGLDPVSWYATYFNRRVIHDIPVGVQDRNHLEQEDFFDKMSFKRTWLDPAAMEGVAHWSEVAVNVIQMGLHLFSIEGHDVSSNVTHAVLQAGKAVLTGLMGYNNDAGWVTAYQALHNNYVDIFGTMALSLLTGFEGAHAFKGEEQSVFWITLVGKDATEALLYKNWTARARQGLLSILTLLNSDLATKPNSENHTKVEGLAMLVSEVTSWLFAGCTGRKYFGFPAHGGSGAFVGFWALGAAGAWAGAVTGWLLGWALSCIDKPAGTEDDQYFPGWPAFGWITLESLLAGIFKYPIYNYFWWNGDTDGGKFGKDNAFPPQFQTFKGYPKDKAGSPYKQPYAKGTVRQCAQNNLGPWSHNANTNQIYAYDWDHDHGSEVLSVRGGTVEGYSDIMPDHTTLQDNNLQILHNSREEGVTPNPDHDLDWTPNPVLTTAQYIHGKHFGVRHVFAALGIPPDFIVGTPVPQGQLVMFSGDTGMSFYNHLHFHVSSANARSLPFVFQDSPETDGRLKDLTWYGSDNERVPNPVGLTLGNPPEQSSAVHYRLLEVVTTTANTVALKFWYGWVSGKWTKITQNGVGSDVGIGVDNIFQGCVVRWERPGQADVMAEILEYTWIGDPTYEMRIKLKNNWSSIPPNTTKVSIESRARAATANTLVLDAYADYTRDDYTGANVLVWWKDVQGQTVYQYKTVHSYDKGSRTITLTSNWDVVPGEFAEFEIGQRPYAQANAFKRRFAFIEDATAGPDLAPPYLLTNVGYSFSQHYSDLVDNFPGLGSDKLTLAVGAPSDPALVDDRFVAITDGPLSAATTRILGYREITHYNPGTREITVNRAWDFTIISFFHHYVIGYKVYGNADAGEKDLASFLCPDSNPDAYTPTDMGDGRKPFVSQTFKSW